MSLKFGGLGWSWLKHLRNVKVVYRIRYQGESEFGEKEAAVEASNPTEAVVKFCHTHNEPCSADRIRDKITSVSVEPALD